MEKTAWPKAQEEAYTKHRRCKQVKWASRKKLTEVFMQTKVPMLRGSGEWGSHNAPGNQTIAQFKPTEPLSPPFIHPQSPHTCHSYFTNSSSVCRAAPCLPNTSIAVQGQQVKADFSSMTAASPCARCSCGGCSSESGSSNRVVDKLHAVIEQKLVPSG